MTGRRERLRAELVRDIKDAALGQLREVGAEDLSLRAIARDVGMSPAGLYRYFDGRDALLTSLIEEGFDDLADHLFTAISQPELVHAGHGRPAPAVPEVAAADAPPVERQLALARAYRAWGLAHPNEFGLLYGDPVRGYSAPAGGVTVTANSRVSQAMLTPLVEALLAGRLVVPPSYAAITSDPGGERLAADIAAIVGHEIGPGAALSLIGAWARLHGIVSLEVFGQFHWLYPSDATPLFEAEMAAMVADLGLAGT